MQGTFTRNGINWTIPDIRWFEALGFIPTFLHSRDPRSAREQFQENYAHGGGWSPMNGWEVGGTGAGPETVTIQYPDDEPLKPIAFTKLRDEEILIYPNAWVMILQADGSFEVSRMD